MKKIVLTGGGTAGHVTPNIALIPKLQQLNYEIHYIGSYDGIEKKLIEELDIPYYGISSGKLRRYFNPKNFTDPFRVIKGFSQAKKIIDEINPDVVFSKGGFVTVPVIFAANAKKVPCIIHESDITPGLANKLSLPKATKVCCNFPETLESLPIGKAILTGTPIRQELFLGNTIKGMEICNFKEKRPTILIIGGSLGSVIINEAIFSSIDDILKFFNVIHICGKDKTNPALSKKENYIQFEYVKHELTHLLALCDIVISRAGANAICELLALKKPSILIPLSLRASRGDQIANALSFEKLGYSHVIQEENLTTETLLSALKKVYNKKSDYINNMETRNSTDAITLITNLIEELANNN